LPNLRPRKSEVLATESHVVANSGEHHLGIGILQNEADVPTGIHRSPAVE
jgi:hypothetical protein